ncbi:hypothetical protein HNY73_004967 [Argiope bruennichi]|uniref:Uncharacterized protein n=1 Tax=Argiope bruennichi TaxID=94029 RepID=A0A8T0FQN6_ARGBR|nr:hypothetical protein HNY73_004967 [Argiope bruennichi]
MRLQYYSFRPSGPLELHLRRKRAEFTTPILVARGWGRENTCLTLRTSVTNFGCSSAFDFGGITSSYSSCHPSTRGNMTSGVQIQGNTRVQLQQVIPGITIYLTHRPSFNKTDMHLDTRVAYEIGLTPPLNDSSPFPPPKQMKVVLTSVTRQGPLNKKEAPRTMT